MPRSPPRRFGDYDQVATLKSGGMGEVLLARKTGAMGFERLAAVKTIRDDRRTDESARDMFRDEARIAARLHHPAIAQVYDFGVGEDGLYLVMEYVAGVSLDALAGTATEPVTPLHVARIGATAARGLHAAHELTTHDGTPLRVVHRDVSPQNVMLTFDGAVKVIDFGIAWARDRGGSTAVGAVKGKPAYMAPEQLDERGGVDRRADLWSLAVVLWELLAGRRLFAGADSRAVARSVLTQVVPPLPGEVPPLFADVISRCLSRDAADRPATALEVAVVLDDVAARGEVLDSFAARALGDAKRAHDTWLREALAGRVEPRPKGRAPELGTQSASQVILAGTETGPATFAEPKRRKAWRLYAIAAGAATVMAALGLFALGRVDEPPAPPAPPPVIAMTAAPPTEQPTEPVAAPPQPTTPLKTARQRPPKHTTSPHQQPTPTSAKPEIAYVRAIAEPYALVRINGTVIGPTPVAHHQVDAGTVLVELLEPDSGTVRVKRLLHVSAGETATVGATP